MLAGTDSSQQAASELDGDGHEAPCSINELPPAILVNSDRSCCMQTSLVSFCQPEKEFCRCI